MDPSDKLTKFDKFIPYVVISVLLSILAYIYILSIGKMAKEDNPLYL